MKEPPPKLKDQETRKVKTKKQDKTTRLKQPYMKLIVQVLKMSCLLKIENERS